MGRNMLGMSRFSSDGWLRMQLIPRVNRVPQRLQLTLLCDTSSDSPNPTLVSYTVGALSLRWETPDACPRSGDPSNPSNPSGSSGGGGGFFSFVKTLFWLIIIGLILYFAIGKLMSDFDLVHCSPADVHEQGYSITISNILLEVGILYPTVIFGEKYRPFCKI